MKHKIIVSVLSILIMFLFGVYKNFVEKYPDTYSITRWDRILTSKYVTFLLIFSLSVQNVLIWTGE